MPKSFVKSSAPRMIGSGNHQLRPSLHRLPTTPAHPHSTASSPTSTSRTSSGETHLQRSTTTCPRRDHHPSRLGTSASRQQRHLQHLMVHLVNLHRLSNQHSTVLLWINDLHLFAQPQLYLTKQLNEQPMMLHFNKREKQASTLKKPRAEPRTSPSTAKKPPPTPSLVHNGATRSTSRSWCAFGSELGRMHHNSNICSTRSNVTTPTTCPSGESLWRIARTRLSTHRIGKNLRQFGKHLVLGFMAETDFSRTAKGNTL